MEIYILNVLNQILIYCNLQFVALNWEKCTFAQNTYWTYCQWLYDGILSELWCKCNKAIVCLLPLQSTSDMVIINFHWIEDALTLTMRMKYCPKLVDISVIIVNNSQINKLQMICKVTSKYFGCVYWVEVNMTEWCSTRFY